jgi:histidinol-phosphate aminotransferase
VIPELLEQRAVLQAALCQRGAQVWPSAGNFLYFRVPNSQQFQRDLQVKGTLIRYSGGGLRVTVGTPAENQRFVERMDQLLG